MILTLGAGVDEMDPTEDVTDADSAPATMFLHMYSLLSEKLKKEKKTKQQVLPQLNLCMHRPINHSDLFSDI